MRSTTIRCGCGVTIKQFEFDDDKDNVEMTGMCSRCSELGAFYVDPEEERRKQIFIADVTALTKSQKGARKKR